MICNALFSVSALCLCQLMTTAALNFVGTPAFTPSLVTKGKQSISSLPCTATTTSGTVAIQFFAFGRSVPLSSNGKYTVLFPTPASFISTTLFIHNLVARDSGDYTCVASLLGDSLMNITAVATLEVETGPVNITLKLLPNQVILVNRSFKLTCSVAEDVYPLPDVELRRNGTLVQSVKGITNVYTVVNASQIDEGTYSCVAINRVNATMSHSQTVTVEASAVIGSFCDRDSTGVQRICTGQREEILCKASGDPQPDVMISGKRSSSLSLNAAVIILDPAALTDNGTYTCTANNTHATVKETCPVDSGDPPNPLGKDQTIAVTEGDPVTLLCSRSGVPLGKLRWFEGSVERTDLENQEMVNFIAAVEKNGRMWCNVSNRCGWETRMFDITVTVDATLLPTVQCLNSYSCSSYGGCSVHLPYQHIVTVSAEARSFPDISTVVLQNQTQQEIGRSTIPIAGPPDDAYRVQLQFNVSEVGNYTFHTEDANASLIIAVTADHAIVSATSSPAVLTASAPSQGIMCVARSYPCQSEIVWKQGNVTMSGVDSRVFDVDGANLVTSVLTVSQCNGLGSYTCELVAHAEERSIDVEAEPMFVNDSARLAFDVSEGGNVILDCRSTGCPVVSVSWSGTGANVPTGDQDCVTLSTVQPKDSGQYVCEVRNKHGVITRTFTVSVKVEPDITNSSKMAVGDVNLPEGARVDVFCDARGYPSASAIVWTDSQLAKKYGRNSSAVTSDGSYLTHSVLSVNHTGTYTCSIGGTSEELQIQVVARLTITFTTENANLDQTGSLQLMCQARAFPTRPIITWSAVSGDGISMTLSDTSVELPDGSYSQTSTVAVTSVGIYTCRVEAGPDDPIQKRNISVKAMPTVFSVDTQTSFASTLRQSSATATQSPESSNKMKCGCISTASIAGISVAVGLCSAAISSLLTYAAVARKHKAKRHPPDRVGFGMTATTSPTSSPDYEVPDHGPMCARVSGPNETLTSSALYAAMGGNGGGASMSNNPAYDAIL